ncbi:MAG: MFS transporter, partial [Actinomycetota bacterium]|nr:MFS transporter [Actinomycetota bacterium]
MMGQGALNLTATTSVALWFSRKRGLAMGIVTAVGAVGMTLVPLLGESLIADYGWRQTWVIEGLVVWALVLPIAIFGIRNRPSDVGQYVDGDPAPVDGSDDVWGVKRSEALRTGFFWLVTAAVATISAIITAVVFHQIDLLGSRGLTPTEAAANFIPQTVATLIATLGIGALADRFSPRVVLATSMVMLAGGLTLGTAVTPGFVAISFGMLIGAAGGAMRVVEATELPRYFGTLHIGAIRGVVTSVGIAGAAIGPLAFSVIHDITGNYTTVLVVSIIVPAAVMVATFIVRLPQHSEPDASGESHVVNKA